MAAKLAVDWTPLLGAAVGEGELVVTAAVTLVTPVPVALAVVLEARVVAVEENDDDVDDLVLDDELDVVLASRLVPSVSTLMLW